MYQVAICLVLMFIGLVVCSAILYSHEQRINALMSGHNPKKGSANQYYNLLKSYYPQADALYEDTIIDVVGKQGLRILIEAKMIEACANFDERKLYAL